MNRSTPGLPVHHQLPGFTQTHVHRVGDAIQPSHPLSSPSPPAFNLSQQQGLFPSVSSSLGGQSIVIILFLLFYTEKPVQRICMTIAKVLQFKRSCINFLLVL